jgi:hypothetical protein
MELQFNIISLAQQNFIKMLDALNIEQINKVPDGFNNNLIWNYAHIVASMQMLCYFRPGLPIRLDETFVNTYKIGTRPEKFISKEEYEKVKVLADKGLDQLKEDYRNGIFKAFNPYTTSTGLNVTSIEFAITYVCLHNGMHIGAAQAIRKLVTQTEKV